VKPPFVIPAQAGIHASNATLFGALPVTWVSAFAGMMMLA
jgi:hypothetical protein